MKVLIIAMSSSIHTTRWIKQLKDSGLDIYFYPSDMYLFPSIDEPLVCKDIQWVNKCIPLYGMFKLSQKLKIEKAYVAVYRALRKLCSKIWPNYNRNRLRKCINIIKPDLIHSMETQSAGYQVGEVKMKFYRNAKFPLWWHTNWGSDIYLFERIPAHQEKVRQVMQNCDYYSCECFRDVELAINNGFKGKLLTVYPNAGGFDLNELQKLRDQSAKPSERKIILLKGYQGWAGRALVGIRALERCADVLKGFELYIHSNTQALDVQISAAVFTHATNIPVNLVPINTPHNKIMELQGKSRISIGLGISDGISTSLLEAMAMGSFPIQSHTACANEWITDLETGFIVPPEDPEVIEQAIRKALADDSLVDLAAEANYLTIAQKADQKVIKKLTIEAYYKALNL
jgi:hypothetical protein